MGTWVTIVDPHFTKAFWKKNITGVLDDGTINAVHFLDAKDNIFSDVTPTFLQDIVYILIA